MTTHPTMTPTFEPLMLSFSLGVNSRAELVTLAPGLRLERRFAPLARGLACFWTSDLFPDYSGRVYKVGSFPNHKCTAKNKIVYK